MSGKILSYPKPPRKRALKKTLFLIAFVLFVFFTGYLFLGQTLHYLQTKKEINKLGSELEAIRAENESLKREIILLQDHEYVEIQARKHLGMVRPGEIIFFVGD